MHDLFYFTDIHGQLDLFQTMRDWCYKQDPECTIIYGGDACDRGEFGFDIMELILDDPQMIYIRGNHEVMFLQAAAEILEVHPEIKNRRLTIQEASDIIDECSWMRKTRLHLYNGGYPTLKTWMLEGTSQKFLQRLEDSTAYTIQADNGLYFSHSSPTKEAFERVNQAEYDGVEPQPDDINEVIWSRETFNSWWGKNDIIIFGHTPTCYMSDFVWTLDEQAEDQTHPISYQSKTDSDEYGTHIAMDTGAFFSGRSYVLNCLTMTVIGFKDPDFRQMTTKRPIEQEFEKYKII